MLEMNCDLCHNFHPLEIVHFGECSPYYGCLQFDGSFLEKKKKKKNMVFCLCAGLHNSPSWEAAVTTTH